MFMCGICLVWPFSLANQRDLCLHSEKESFYQLLITCLTCQLTLLSDRRSMHFQPLQFEPDISLLCPFPCLVVLLHTKVSMLVWLHMGRRKNQQMRQERISVRLVKRLNVLPLTRLNISLIRTKSVSIFFTNY